MKMNIGVIGGGNFGTAISNILALSIENKVKFNPIIKVWIFDEQVESEKGDKLSICTYINKYRENIKYLPGIRLPENLLFVTSEYDYIQLLKESDILIYVIPSFVAAKFVNDLKKYNIQNKIIVTLMKGFISIKDSVKPVLFSDYVTEKLNMPCAAVMGANIANDMHKNICEMTIGTRENSEILEDLFSTKTTRVSTVDDVKAVELFAALKNIVAIAYGISVGLNLSVNTQMSILRKGILEMMKMAKLYDTTTNQSTMFESCGIPDLMVSCLHGRNAKGGIRIAAENLSVANIEKEMNGQVLHGVSTVNKIYSFLESINKTCAFPLFCAVYLICKGEKKASSLVECIIK